ncbi:MAG: hypothetical protein KGL48_17210 [Sphingomonadales bacterium]|nr:hypothetical protein [Sphingomonadales bacterium]MDE2567694.1 hypothetical protein [Sphingomonadales bacterium]
MKIARMVALAAVLIPTPALACASCGCTFTSDWLSQGLVTQPGSAVSLRWDYVPQTRLRSGTETVDTTQIALPVDYELEQRTYNSYVTLSYDRQWANDWGINVSLPFVTRPHSTIAEGETDPSRSTGSGIGDARIVARWQGLSTPGGVTGLQFGLVLPTGGFHRTFTSGPEAGSPIDRGLQPGTGTVQGVVGAYHYGRVGQDFALVLQAQGQFALNDREGYRPGTVGEASAAVQFIALRGVTPELQVNFRANARDSGVNSDRANSGGEQVYLSPGLSAKVSDRVSAFALVQVPVYQRVNGLQLTPRVTTSAGLQARF